MRENRQSGSEGGGTEPNRFSLPLSNLITHYVQTAHHLKHVPLAYMLPRKT